MMYLSDIESESIESEERYATEDEIGLVAALSTQRLRVQFPSVVQKWNTL